ncbi:MAG TPA: DUF2459 domain-containing protein [Methylomirabilota bacterium]|nr:DUF2459 domain-containing protein [Methylomirabilota bacterium]
MLRAATALAVMLVLGCASPSATREPGREDSLAYRVWVVDHGWHTAIVVRARDVDSSIWPEVADFAGVDLVEVAWGDREFYMAERPSGWLAVKAAFFTSGSALHVAGLGAPIERHFPASDVVELAVSRRGLDAMTRLFHDEYQRGDDGRPVRLAPGLYGAGWFYAARSRYHLFNTCNTWVARALRAAGLDITPAGIVTAGGLMQEVRRATAAR